MICGLTMDLLNKEQEYYGLDARTGTGKRTWQGND